MKINLSPLKMSLFCNTEYDIWLAQHFLSMCFHVIEGIFISFMSNLYDIK